MSDELLKITKRRLVIKKYKEKETNIETKLKGSYEKDNQNI